MPVRSTWINKFELFACFVQDDDGFMANPRNTFGIRDNHRRNVESDYLCRVTADTGDLGRSPRVRADSASDGDTAFATHEEIDEQGKTTRTEVLTAENAQNAEEKAGELHDEPPPYGYPLPSDGRGAAGEGVRCRTFDSDGAHVESPAELVRELEADGKQLRVVNLTDYTTAKVRTLCGSPDEQAVPAPNGVRAPASDRGLWGSATCTFATLAAQADQPDAAHSDLRRHLAFNEESRAHTINDAAFYERLRQDFAS